MTKELDDIIIEHQFFSSDEAERNIEGRLLVADRLFQNMLEGVFITDTKGIIRFINPAFSMITGFGEEVIGKTPGIFQSGKHDEAFYRNMWESIEQNGKWMGEIWNKKEDGELFLQQTTITKINDDHGQPLYYAAVITDITARKKAEQRLKDDLLLAKEVQKSALSHPIQNDSFHIEGIYLPSDILGGDTYAWYQIDSHRYGVIMLDVMGHGVASALVCMSVRSLLRGIVNKCVEPEIVLKELNKHVYSLFQDKESLQMKNYYLTCVYAMVDTNTHTIQFASAGHPPALLLSANGSVRELADGTVPLGMLEEIEVQTGSYTYESAQTWMVFYTDGLIESEENQIRKNIEKLKDNLLKHRTNDLSTMLSLVIEQQCKDLNTPAFYDDVTMLIAKL